MLLGQRWSHVEVDPHELSRSFDSRVRATDREISKNQHAGLGPSRSTAVWWLMAALVVALVIGAAVGGFLILRG